VRYEVGMLVTESMMSIASIAVILEALFCERSSELLAG